MALAFARAHVAQTHLAAPMPNLAELAFDLFPKPSVVGVLLFEFAYSRIPDAHFLL